jgi:hypothetical protein
MRQKCRIILGVITAALAFGTYATFTGGLTYERLEHFDCHSIQLENGQRLVVSLNGKTTNISVPFLFHYYRERRPFDIGIQIWDDEKQYRTIEVSRVIVDYTDGESISREVVWSRQLRVWTQYNSSTDGVTKQDVMMVNDQIPDIVKRHADVRIMIVGNLVKITGEKIRFNASDLFKAESRSRWGTWWEAIAGC